MAEFFKRQKVGTYITALVAVLALVSLIIYAVNGAADGYFKGLTETPVVLMSVIAILCAAGSIVLAQFEFEGNAAKAANLFGDALRIAAAMLLIASMLLFIGSRVEGLAYIFGSDENVLDEVQTPANLSSAYTAICGFVFYAISWVFAMAAAFFSMVKKTA